jgi:hypothetical protein
MVVTKMANRLQACMVSSAGHGMRKRMASPTATAIAALPKSAGCMSSGGVSFEVAGPGNGAFLLRPWTSGCQRPSHSVWRAIGIRARRGAL